MSSLVDWQIEELATHHELVWPYNPSQLNPASYDVRLAEQILIEAPPVDGERVWYEWNLSKESYFLEPGEFILGCVKEVLNIPSQLEAIFCLKSTGGRQGYDHVLSAYIDPGYRGRITLELHNTNRFNRLELRNGMRIGQIRFSTIAERPRKTYAETGHYQGDMGPVPSRG
jgi:dCTP deaminase